MRNRRRVLGALLAACVLGGGAVAAGAVAKPTKQSDVFKAAWIYVGPHNDGGWSQAHDQGRLAVQKAFGGKVQTTYKENIAPGPQLQQHLLQRLAAGVEHHQAVQVYLTVLADHAKAQSRVAAGRVIWIRRCNDAKHPLRQPVVAAADGVVLEHVGVVEGV